MIDAAQTTSATQSKPLPPGRDPEAIKKATQDFEALLIAGILKMVRESASLDKSGMGEGDQAGATALEMAEEQLSRSLAQNGGIGLDSLLANGLASPGAANTSVRAVHQNANVQSQSSSK